MKPGGDAVDFIATMDDLRPRLGMVEKILDDTYADVLLNSFPKEFEFKRQMHRTDRSSNFEQIKQTANNFHLDDLFRNRLRLPFLSVERRWPLRQAATNVTTVRLPATSSATAVSLRRRIVPSGGRKRVRKAKVAILRPSGVPTTRPPPTTTLNITSRKITSSWLRTWSSCGHVNNASPTSGVLSLRKPST